MINNITLHGRIGAINSYKVFTNRQTGKQQPSMILSIAVDRPYKNQQGQYSADWFSIVVNGRSASFLHQYAQPGSELMVSGPMHQNHFTDRNGQHRSSYQVRAFSIDLIFNHNHNQQSSNNSNQHFNSNPNYNRSNNNPNYRQPNNNPNMNNQNPNNNTNNNAKNPFNNKNKIDVSNKSLPF